MGKIIVFMSLSIDGRIAGPGGDLSWHRVDEEVLDYFNGVLGATAGFIDGRVVHQLMEDYWPTADQDPAASRSTAEFARIWREKPKTVYSTTLPPGPAAWNTTIVPAVVPEEVAELKADGDLSLGGAGLAASFRRLDLIDEYHLCIHPVVVGAGKLMFPDTDGPSRQDFELSETRTFSNGVVLLRHVRAR